MFFKGKALTRLNFSSASSTSSRNHPGRHPGCSPSSLYLTPAGSGCRAGSAGRRAANRIFSPPFLLLSGSLQHTVKPFIDKEGKGFTTVFKASPGSRKKPLPAHTILGSTRAPGEQKPKPAACPHLQLTELASCPNPSSQPRSRTPLGHGVLRNSLSAKRQRQLLQKQNKIEYKKEQRVCRANCCSGKTPKLTTSSPYRQRPRPPSQLPMPPGNGFSPGTQ